MSDDEPPFYVPPPNKEEFGIIPIYRISDLRRAKTAKPIMLLFLREVTLEDLR